MYYWRCTNVLFPSAELDDDKKRFHSFVYYNLKTTSKTEYLFLITEKPEKHWKIIGTFPQQTKAKPKKAKKQQQQQQVFGITCSKKLG